NAGMVAGSSASIMTSRAMLLHVRFGTTLPQTAKSGVAPPRSAIMCLTTGTESAIASSLASGPSTFANGVRTPHASQMSVCRRSLMRLPPRLRGAPLFFDVATAHDPADDERQERRHARALAKLRELAPVGFGDMLGRRLQLGRELANRA